MLVKGMAGVSTVLHDGDGRPLGAFGLLVPNAGLNSHRGRKLIESLRRERDWAERELAVRKHRDHHVRTAARNKRSALS